MSCSIVGCDKPVKIKARGWCAMHNERWRRHGDPLVSKVIWGNDTVRFFSKVSKTEDCWLWEGALNNQGYPTFYAKNQQHYAHRWSFEKAYGPIPAGLVIDHLCRTPACVRPDHLEAVTQKENTRRGLASFEFTGTCRRGHDVTDPANVYAGPNYRTCRICRGR